MKMSSVIPEVFNFGTNFCGRVRTISAMCTRLRTTNLRWTAQTVLQEGSSLSSLFTKNRLPCSSLFTSPDMLLGTEWKLIYHLSNLAASLYFSLDFFIKFVLSASFWSLDTYYFIVLDVCFQAFLSWLASSQLTPSSGWLV